MSYAVGEKRGSVVMAARNKMAINEISSIIMAKAAASISVCMAAYRWRNQAIISHASAKWRQRRRHHQRKQKRRKACMWQQMA